VRGERQQSDEKQQRAPGPTANDPNREARAKKWDGRGRSEKTVSVGRKKVYTYVIFIIFARCIDFDGPTFAAKSRRKISGTYLSKQKRKRKYNQHQSECGTEIKMRWNQSEA
jgi:hypothetical protein